MTFQVPNGKNFFLTPGSTQVFPIGARLTGALLPHPVVLEEGGTVFLPTNQATNPALIFTRPDGTTFTRFPADGVYIGKVTVPQTFNGVPFSNLSQFYAVYTFAVNELSEGGFWEVAILGPNGIQENRATFLVRGFVLVTPTGTIPVLSTGPGGLILSTGPGTVLQTGPAT